MPPEDGRRDVPDAQLLGAVDGLEPRATTPDIAGAVGMTPQGAGYRLRQLEEEGRVRSEKIGTTNVWEVVE